MLPPWRGGPLASLRFVRMTWSDDPNTAWEMWQRLARDLRRDRQHACGQPRDIVTADDACSALTLAVQSIGAALKGDKSADDVEGLLSAAVVALLAAREYILPLPSSAADADEVRANVEALAATIRSWGFTTP